MVSCRHNTFCLDCKVIDPEWEAAALAMVSRGEVAKSTLTAGELLTMPPTSNSPSPNAPSAGSFFIQAPTITPALGVDARLAFSLGVLTLENV